MESSNDEAGHSSNTEVFFSYNTLACDLLEEIEFLQERRSDEAVNPEIRCQLPGRVAGLEAMIEEGLKAGRALHLVGEDRQLLDAVALFALRRTLVPMVVMVRDVHNGMRNFLAAMSGVPEGQLVRGEMADDDWAGVSVGLNRITNDDHLFTESVDLSLAARRAREGGRGLLIVGAERFPLDVDQLNRVAESLDFVVLATCHITEINPTISAGAPHVAVTFGEDARTAVARLVSPLSPTADEVTFQFDSPSGAIFELSES